MLKWDKKSDLAEDVINLINDDKALNKMKDNMKKIREEIKNDYLINSLSA